jgi:hypothetical protein
MKFNLAKRKPRAAVDLIQKNAGYPSRTCIISISPEVMHNSDQTLRARETGPSKLLERRLFHNFEWNLRGSGEERTHSCCIFTKVNDDPCVSIGIRYKKSLFLSTLANFDHQWLKTRFGKRAWKRGISHSFLDYRTQQSSA